MKRLWWHVLEFYWGSHLVYDIHSFLYPFSKTPLCIEVFQFFHKHGCYRIFCLLSTFWDFTFFFDLHLFPSTNVFRVISVSVFCKYGHYIMIIINITYHTGHSFKTSVVILKLKKWEPLCFLAKYFKCMYFILIYL